MAGRNVLLVEDESYTRASLKFMLQHTGSSVVDVPTGLDAMEHLATTDGTERPHLIVADLCRPSNIGRDFIKALQAGLIQVPALGIVSLPGKEGELLVESPGDNLDQSFDNELFVKCVNQLLESYRLKQPDSNFMQIPWFFFHRRECPGCG